MSLPFSRRKEVYVDDRGEEYDSEWFTYSFVPNAASAESGVSGTIAPGATAIGNIQIEAESWFQWVYTNISANNAAFDNSQLGGGLSSAPNLLVQIMDGGTTRNLFSNLLPVALVAGGFPGFPYRLPTPRMFKPTSSINFQLKNAATGVTMNQVQLNMMGRKLWVRRGQRPPERFKAWREGRSWYAEDYYAYDFPLGAVPHGTTNTPFSKVFSQLIQADSDFEAVSLSAAVGGLGNDGVVTSPPIYMQYRFKDGGAQRELSSTPLEISTNAGFGGNQLLLPEPRLFLARTTVQCKVYNCSTATDVPQIDLVLTGRKIFEFEGE